MNVSIATSPRKNYIKTLMSEDGSLMSERVTIPLT